MLRRKDANYDVVGFIDDDPAKQGMSIHGITVLGNMDQLPQICEKFSVDEIAIAIPSPWVPPVIRAVFPVRSNSCIDIIFYFKSGIAQTSMSP